MVQLVEQYLMWDLAVVCRRVVEVVSIVMDLEGLFHLLSLVLMVPL
jgi:hypothetical protein